MVEKHQKPTKEMYKFNLCNSQETEEKYKYARRSREEINDPEHTSKPSFKASSLAVSIASSPDT